jgi:hypothetical protein
MNWENKKINITGRSAGAIVAIYKPSDIASKIF